MWHDTIIHQTPMALTIRAHRAIYAISLVIFSFTIKGEGGIYNTSNGIL